MLSRFNKSSKVRGYQAGFFNLFPSVHDQKSRLRKAEKIAYALKIANYPLASSICLDAGCSSGIITSALAPLFAKMIGLDFDVIALANIVPSATRSVLFIQGDLMSLPLSDNAVDVVICAQVYEHVPDDQVMMDEIYRILKPGGIVFLSGPNKLFPIELHYAMPFLHWLPSRIPDGYVRLLGRGDHYYEHSRSLWGLRKLVSRFEVCDITVDLLLTPYLIRSSFILRMIKLVPRVIWTFFEPVFPNFNFILRKRN